MFEAASPLSVAVFRPVLECLRRDPRIELSFMTADHAWNADRIFRAADITENIIPPARARWMKFDLYINTDFWNTTWLPRRVPRLHLFHGVAGKYDLDAPVRIAPVVANFDRLLFPNRDRLLRYAQAGLIDLDDAQGQLVGVPKVDCLVDGSLDRGAIERAIGLDPSLPTVVYAPTWSAYSSLNRSGLAVIDALVRLGVNVIVKLHDRSLDRARSAGGTDWRFRLETLSRQGRVHVARTPDASPYLFASDVLVTDHSSVGFEFMLLDRPVVVLDCPQLVDKARINRDKVALLRNASTVVDPADVAAAVTRSLAHACERSAERRAAAAMLFHAPGGATARAIACIYDLLPSLSAAEAPQLVRTEAVRAGIELAPALAPYDGRTTYRG
jgi:hypothetical protein